MPWLDPKANSVEDAAGAGADDSISTSVLLVVPGPRTIGGPSEYIRGTIPIPAADELASHVKAACPVL